MVTVLELDMFCLGPALNRAAEAVAALVSFASRNCGLFGRGFRLGTCRGEVGSYLGCLTGVVGWGSEAVLVEACLARNAVRLEEREEVDERSVLVLVPRLPGWYSVSVKE